MPNYLEMVPLPSPSDMNKGLSACHQSTMLHLFGKPGALTIDCSAVTNSKLQAELKEHRFNNFSVEGWRKAVESLEQVIAEIYHEKPDLHVLIGTAGMLCCRAVRGSHTNYSNHSWGTAIDLTIGGILSPQHSGHIPRGLVEIYPYFHKHGWYWGAEFPTADPMHFELADETVRKMKP